MNDMSEVLTVTEYDPIATALAELHTRYHGVVYDMTTKLGEANAKEARNDLRSRRIKLEEIRKAIKAPVLAKAKAIDEEAALITARIEALERPIAQQIEAEALRQKEEARAKAEAEANRVKAITDKINAFRTSASRLAGAPPAAIESEIERLRGLAIGDDYAEFRQEAENERIAALNALSVMLDGAKSRAAEAERVAAERAELARLRAAQEEQARAVREAESRAAAADRARLDAEAKANREAEAAQREREFSLAAGVSGSGYIKAGEAIAGAGGGGGATPLPGGMGHGAEGKIQPDMETRQISVWEIRYSVLLVAMQKLRELAVPGTEEHAIITTALEESAN